jgi:hypothetical protein
MIYNNQKLFEALVIESLSIIETRYFAIDLINLSLFFFEISIHFKYQTKVLLESCLEGIKCLIPAGSEVVAEYR